MYISFEDRRWTYARGEGPLPSSDAVSRPFSFRSRKSPRGHAIKRRKKFHGAQPAMRISIRVSYIYIFICKLWTEQRRQRLRKTEAKMCGRRASPCVHLPLFHARCPRQLSKIFMDFSRSTVYIAFLSFCHYLFVTNSRRFDSRIYSCN